MNNKNPSVERRICILLAGVVLDVHSLKDWETHKGTVSVFTRVGGLSCIFAFLFLRIFADGKQSAFIRHFSSQLCPLHCATLDSPNYATMATTSQDSGKAIQTVMRHLSWLIALFPDTLTCSVHARTNDPHITEAIAQQPTAVLIAACAFVLKHRWK